MLSALWWTILEGEHGFVGWKGQPKVTEQFGLFYINRFHLNHLRHLGISPTYKGLQAQSFSVSLTVVSFF